MKILMILAPIVVGLIAAIATMGLIGMFLAKSHTATRSVRLSKSPEEVWSVISDFQSAASWRTSLRSVERAPDLNGHVVWREIDKHGQVMPLEITESTPPRRLVSRIADPKLPFGGTWTYELTAEDGGCRLRITEDGEVYNPMFRFVSKFIGHAGTIEGYLKALGAKLGQTTLIEP